MAENGEESYARLTMPPTLTERVRAGIKRQPTFRQMAAATEILARAAGSDTAQARSDAIAPFVADGTTTLYERLDAAGLTETRILRKLSSKLDARETEFFSKDGLVTDERTVVSHGTQLKATKLALELRGLLNRGYRSNVNVASSGNCQVNFAMPWQPAPALSDNPTVPSNELVTDNRSNNVTSTRSTIEGTGSRGAAQGHSRRVQKSGQNRSSGQRSSARAKSTIEERSRRNKNIKKRVGPNHQGRKRGGGCKSGKCGKCSECKRRAKLRLP